MNQEVEQVDVLYISYDGMTDPLGQSQVIPYLAGLSAKGYSFTLLSFEKPERFAQQAELIRQLLDQHQIHWVPLVYHKKPPVLSTLYDLWQMNRIAEALHNKHHFQIIHCRSYLSAMIGMQMKKKHGARFIFDMRGFWADERVEGGLWNLKNPLFRLIYRFFKQQEKQMLAQADYTISLTHTAKKIIHGWKDIPKQPIPVEVIPCCVDMELFDPEKIKEEVQDTLRQKLGISKEQFVLTYLGSLGTWYLLDEMLLFFKHLLKARPDALFLFITKDGKEAELPALQKLHIPQDKIILQAASRIEVPLYLSLSSASIFFIKPSFSKQASSATKMGEIMSMGIPFVTNKGWGDVEEIVISAGCGVLLDGFSDVAYFQGVEDILNSLNQTKDLHAASKRHYDLKKGISNYESVYQDIIHQRLGKYSCIKKD